MIEDPQGRILALDSENKEVRIFGTDGTPLASLGREGEGPGEFQHPNRLAFFEDGTLMITGRMGRMQFFESTGETYERTGGFTVEFTPEDVCLLENTLYLHGALAKHSEHSIHVYSRDGTRQRSFGPVYDSDNVFVRQDMSGGALTCDRATETVVFAFSSAPLVYGYAPDGGLQWTSHIQPFEPSPTKQSVNEKGTTRLRPIRKPGTHVVINLTDVPGPGVIIQTVEVPPEDAPRSATPLYTYWLSAREGTGQYVGKTTAGGTAAGPITHVSTTHLISARGVPFPQVDIYDLQGVEWAAEQ